MKKKKKLSADGKRIKKKIIDKGMTQAEFCKKYEIKQSRLTELIHGKKYPILCKKVYEILGIGA